jgi:hypothetical protein
MPRPQFSLKTLLWLMALVAAFFAGAEWRRQRMEADIWNISLERAMREALEKYRKQDAARRLRLAAESDSQAPRSGTQE